MRRVCAEEVCAVGSMMFVLAGPEKVFNARAEGKHLFEHMVRDLRKTCAGSTIVASVRHRVHSLERDA